MAAEFYYQVSQAYPNATITLTGHFLGGGLAGLIAKLTGSTAYGAAWGGCQSVTVMKGAPAVMVPMRVVSGRPASRRAWIRASA